MNDTTNILADFSNKVNKKKLGEKIVEEKFEDDITDQQRAVNMDQGSADNKEAAKALAKLRIILNFLMMLPILVCCVTILAYLMMNIFPSILFFLKKILISGL
ncbi:MAG: hypothetical protein LBT02_04205 [Rickettsiales bacterium]|jgi:t-SNARE complex subunit (syntaxin)|nr:hypothetical protein [Rickettsiales bacterium]